MKRLMSAVLALSFAACGGKNEANNDGKTAEQSTPDPNALTEDEQLLVDLLIKISNDFYEPSAVRVIDLGDYRLYDASEYSGMGYGSYYGIKVKLQGENKVGGTLNHPYLIRVKVVGAEEAKRAAAEKKFDSSRYWKENWDKCEPNNYPKSDYKTFEEYREHMIQFYLKDYFYEDEASARTAAEEYVDTYEKSTWDNCAEGKWPRSSYSSWEAYRKYEVDQKMDSYFYPFPNSDGPDRSGCYKELSDRDTISVSAESTFNVSKINKALKAYWDERLGN